MCICIYMQNYIIYILQYFAIGMNQFRSHCASAPENVWFDLFTSNKTQPRFINLPFDAGMKKQYISSEKWEEFESRWTPLKISMEPKNHLFEKENLPNLHDFGFQTCMTLGSKPCIFQGVSLPTFQLLRLFCPQLHPETNPSVTRTAPNKILTLHKM